MTPAVVVGVRNHFETGRMGGVQRCTHEYISLLQAAGFETHLHSVDPTRALGPRLKMRSGIEAYDLYNPDLAAGVIDLARRVDATLIAFNQVSLLPLAAPVRAALPGARLVTLSHGNESGDFLHDAAVERRSAVLQARDALRLGRLLVCEARLFGDVDAVLCLSEVERGINLWLGAREAVVVPRTWEPDPLNWQPAPGRVGFVGTLTHRPNAEGIGRVLRVIESSGLHDLEVRIVGEGASEGAALSSLYERASYLGPLSDADLIAEANTWSAFLNPVWWFSRGASTKLAQAISWGLPTITTPQGLRGYERCSEALWTVTSPEEMVDAAVQISLRSDLRARHREAVLHLSQNGPSVSELADRLRHALGNIDGTIHPDCAK